MNWAYPPCWRDRYYAHMLVWNYPQQTSLRDSNECSRSWPWTLVHLLLWPHQLKQSQNLYWSNSSLNYRATVWKNPCRIFTQANYLQKAQFREMQIEIKNRLKITTRACQSIRIYSRCLQLVDVYFQYTWGLWIYFITIMPRNISLWGKEIFMLSQIWEFLSTKFGGRRTADNFGVVPDTFVMVFCTSYWKRSLSCTPQSTTCMCTHGY